MPEVSLRSRIACAGQLREDFRMHSKIFRALTAVLVVLTASVLLPEGTFATASAQSNSRPAMVIVLDVSGSMNDPSLNDPGQSRLGVAKEALRQAITGLEPGEIDLGLRTFNRCGTRLVQPVGPVNPAALVSDIDGITAGGSTGIQVALEAAVDDLPETSGTRTVLLISDGLETCGGDPCAAAQSLIASGVRFVVNTVGFQTDGTPAEAQLQCIADSTGGEMTPVSDLPELFKVINETVDPCAGDLLTCYAPEVRFHPREDFYPMDPDDFIDGSELVWVRSRQGFRCFGDDTIDPNPTPRKLGGGGYEVFVKELEDRRWRPDACVNVGRPFRSNEFTRPYQSDPSNTQFARAAGLPVEEGFTLVWKNWISVPRTIPLPADQVPIGLNNDPGDGSQLDVPIFAQQIPDPESAGSLLVYHMFYGYDPKSKFDITDFSKAQLGDQVVAHEGDWERIIVALDPADKPVEVRFLGHGCGDGAFRSTNYVSWQNFSELPSPNKVEQRGQLVDTTHPVVYVAEGSHASYPLLRDAGPRVCTTPTGAASGEADQTEFDEAKSVTWRAWELGGVKDPQQECWYGFGGAWGRGGDFAVFEIPLPGWLPGVPDGENRGHDSGPAGPHWNVTGLPEDRNCSSGSFFDIDSLTEPWLGVVRATASGFPANESVVLSLASVETPITNAVTGADGSLVLDFQIPQGFSSGGHDVIVRSLRTGDILGIHPINITIPEECGRIVEPPGTPDDLDGDGLINSCDRFPTDGPFADSDLDGVFNVNDNCPRVSNPDQASDTQASVGHACDIDRGVNPADPLATLLGLDPMGPGTPDVQPISHSADPVDYTPFVNAPPSPTGAFGFGAPPDISLPLALVEQVPIQQSPAIDIDAYEIANTGAENRLIAELGFLLVAVGAYATGSGRKLRRNKQR